MKYIEEIHNGECFTVDNKHYLLTTDFKSNGYRLAYCLEDGCAKWIKNTDIVDPIQVYRLDKDNNIIPLKETKKHEYNFSKNSDIS